MYCSNCGSEIPNNAKFCANCGNACVEPKQEEPMLNNGNTNQFNNSNGYTNNTNNSMAIAGLICSIIGLFVCGIPLGIISVILGIIAHKQAVINRSSTKMITWVIILGAIDIALPIIIIYSWFSQIF